MTAPGRYAASDGSYEKSRNNAAARGGILIAIAVLIGLVLLWQGFDGEDVTPAATDTPPAEQQSEPPIENQDPPAGEDVANSEEDPNAVENSDNTSTTAPLDTVAVDPPSEVSVAVLNGSGVAGQAGQRTEFLATDGYVAVAGNAAENREASAVYYKPEYAEEAKVVADYLAGASGGASALEPITQADSASLGNSEADQTAASDADIIVVLGTDGALA